MIRAVLFDLDDTLIDHTTAIRAAVTELYAQRPELITKFTEEPAFQKAWVDVQDKYYPAYLRGSMSHAEQKILRIRELWQPLANLTEEGCFQIYDHFQMLYAKNWKIFPDVFPCLEALVPLKIGLISNGWGRQQREKLELEGLGKKIEIVVISSEVGMAKPDPRIFQMACAALGVPPSETIYVGDLYDLDVQGPNQAGLLPVWLRRKAGHLESPGVLTIRSLNELAALVREQNRKREPGR
ncbi:MAG: HAD family hydrolase [Bdellovibrionota bacterium]